MDRYELASASQLAQEMCERVATRAAEVGFHDGMITAVRHQGEVAGLRRELFDAPVARPDQLPVTTPCRFAGFPDLQQLFWDTMQEGLEYCIVRFGQLTMVFSKGVLRNVWVTEKFRIEEEVSELGRFFSPPLGQAQEGHGSRRTRDSGSGRPR